MKFLNFKEFLETNVPGYHLDGATASYLSSFATGSEMPDKSLGHYPSLDSTDLALPQTVVTAPIVKIDFKKNPIQITLRDARKETNLYLTYDEFNRIKGNIPTVGKTMTVTFLRSPEDGRQQLSQIQSARVY